jgi:hypothetical protein
MEAIQCLILEGVVYWLELVLRIRDVLEFWLEWLDDSVSSWVSYISRPKLEQYVHSDNSFLRSLSQFLIHYHTAVLNSTLHRLVTERASLNTGKSIKPKILYT